MRFTGQHWVGTFVLLMLCLASRLLSAQALPTATAPGGYVSVGGGGSIFQADYGKRDIAGVTAYADLHPTWRFGIEMEARFLHFHTFEDVSEANYLIGPRISFRPGSRVRPYAKFLVGDGKIVLPFHYAEGNFFTYAPGGGVDYQLSDRIAIRAIDFEYQKWPDFPYGELNPYGISMGVSVRLNSIPRYPKHARF